MAEDAIPEDAIRPEGGAGDTSAAKGAPVLEIDGLTIRFAASVSRSVEKAEENVAVDAVSLSVAPGETLALVGESGSGKSLTALSTLQLLPPGAKISGSVKLRGEEMVGAPEPVLRRHRGATAGLIFQEPMTSLNPLHTVQKQIGETLIIHQGMADAQARLKTLELLERVEIDEPERRLDAYPHQLSGGQRQRVMIAMALANQPELLIADEPTTALDVTIQAQILKLLQSLQRDTGMAMLFITHDLGVVRAIADRVAVMEHGAIREMGETERIFTAPEHSYTQKLLSAEPEGLAEPAYRHAAEVLSARDLKVWFPIRRGLLRSTVGHKKAVRQASLTLRAGETLGVVGESGSGKTTLGLALLRLISSDGAIAFEGEAIDGLSPRDMRPKRARMQIVFQDPYGALSPRMSVAEIIGEGLELHMRGEDGRPEPVDARRAAVAEVLEEVGLEAEMMDRYPHEFSGGQRQRIAIARAMILKPKLVVLDEPTSALDRTVQAQIVTLLRELQKKYGLAYLFISHDLKVVRAMAHRIIVMKDGDIVEQGASEDVLLRPKTGYTQALMAAAFDLVASDSAAISQ